MIERKKFDRYFDINKFNWNKEFQFILQPRYTGIKRFIKELKKRKGDNMVINSIIQVKSLYIHIENNEELTFLKRMIFERLRNLNKYNDSDSKEKEFVDKLYMELWKMEMTK